MKKYLKTPEEVIDALEAGKVIHHSKDNRTFLMNRKYIVRQCSSGVVYFGAQIEMDGYPYIEVEDPKPEIKLEVGKFYKTRDGRKMFCYCKQKESDAPFRCVSVGTCDTNSYSFREDGNYLGNGVPSYFDIVSEWEEEHAEND